MSLEKKQSSWYSGLQDHDDFIRREVESNKGVLNYDKKAMESRISKFQKQCHRLMFEASLDKIKRKYPQRFFNPKQIRGYLREYLQFGRQASRDAMQLDSISHPYPYLINGKMVGGVLIGKSDAFPQLFSVFFYKESDRKKHYKECIEYTIEEFRKRATKSQYNIITGFAYVLPKNETIPQEILDEFNPTTEDDPDNPGYIIYRFSIADKIDKLKTKEQAPQQRRRHGARRGPIDVAAIADRYTKG